MFTFPRVLTCTSGAWGSRPSRAARCAMHLWMISRYRGSPVWFLTLLVVFLLDSSPVTTADWAGSLERSQAAQASRSIRSSFLSSISRARSKSRTADSFHIWRIFEMSTEIVAWPFPIFWAMACWDQPCM